MNSPLSYKKPFLLTPKNKCLLTYSILTILFSSYSMAETGKQKAKHFISLPDGEKQYLNDDIVIPSLKNSEFGVPINRADIEAAGSTVEEYMEYLRNQKKTEPEPPKANPEPMTTKSDASSGEDKQQDGDPQSDQQNADNDKPASEQTNKNKTTSETADKTKKQVAATKEQTKAEPATQTKTTQQIDLSEVSSAPHAAMLMRQTTIIATSNIAARFNNGGERGINSGSSFAQNNFWGNINYFTGNNDTDVTGKYDLNSTGITLGYDRAVGHLEELIFGGAFTYAKGKADRNSKNIKMDQDLYLGSLYSKFLFRQFDMLAAVHFGKAENSQELGSTDGLKSDYDSTLWGITLQGGYIFNTPHINVKPLVEFNYLNSSFDDINSSFDDINISANDNNAKIQNGDMTVTELGAGIQLFKSRELKDNKGKVRFHGQLMAYHDFNDDKQETKIPVSINPLSTKSFNNEIKSQERYRAGVGVGIQTRKNLSFDLDYDYFWNDKSNINAFALRVGYLF